MKSYNLTPMKRFAITIFSFLLVMEVAAQSSRLGVLDRQQQSFGLSVGLDYSVLPIILAYKHGVRIFGYKHPASIGVEVTIPAFAFDLADIRFRMNSEATIYRKNNFEVRAGIAPLFVNTKMETQRMASLGMDFHLFTGFSNRNWNNGFEVKYNQVLFTHITHNAIYREQVLQAAIDGWYGNTASNFRFGALVNRRVNQADVFFKGGVSQTGKLNDYLFVPTMYLHAGINYRF